MWELLENIPLWLEVKVDIALIGRYNTLAGLEKGEEVLLTDIFVDMMGDVGLYDVCFQAKRYRYRDRRFFEESFKAMGGKEEVMIEGDFYVESREEFDVYFKVLDWEE